LVQTRYGKYFCSFKQGIPEYSGKVRRLLLDVFVVNELIFQKVVVLVQTA